MSFDATIPDTTSVGTHHNPEGVIFLDPTRTTTVARMAGPLTNVVANRTSISNSSNTTYANGATANVAGGNYSGLVDWPMTENVTLLSDLSVTKSTNTPTFTLGATLLSYNIVGLINVGPITDTLHSGMTLTALTVSPTATWNCTPNASSTTFTCSASGTVFPRAAATNLVTATATVSFSSTACPGPQLNSATITTATIGGAVPSNNAGTVTTPINCNVNLTVTKTDCKTTVTPGGATSYTETFASRGPAAGDGSVVRDTPSNGLSCAVASCTAAGTGVCPASGLWPNLLSAGELTLASFASGATDSFVVTCNATATGQ